MNMNHEEYKILLSAYFDGEVSPEEKTIIEDHLIGCAECQKEYDEYKKISMSLKRWSKERLSPDVELNIEARLAKTKERTMEKEREIQWGPLVGVLMVMVLAVSVFQQYAKRNLQAKVRDASFYLTDKKQKIALGKTEQSESYYGNNTDTVNRVGEEERSSQKNKDFGSGSLQDSLKHSTDKIGEQFSPENSSYRKTEKVPSAAAVEGAAFAVAKKGDSYDQSYIDKNSLANVRSRENEPARAVTGSAGLADGKDSRQTLALAQKAQYEPYYLSSNYELKSKLKEADKIARLDYPVQEAPRSLVAPTTVVTNGQFEGYRMPMERRQLRDEEELQYGGYDRSYDPVYPAPPAQTETYESVRENNFESPLNIPLSTFSIDVDTASYSNVRRFLNQNQLPPPEAVRVEELINYFSYDYPQPMWGQPFSITTEIGPCPWNPSRQLALIGLQGKRLSTMNMPASNLVFLIDVSGSMNQPNKLPLLQDAFRMMVQELEGKDKVSIVVYAGSAGVVLEATSGNFKGRINEAINSLSAGGSTAGGEGIRLAYRIARNNLISGGNNRVVLATDGDFNIGVSSDDELVRMIESYRNEGVFLTVLGFGEGNLKDAKMEKLADYGNGNYFYIDNLSEARKVLVNELGSTLFTIAKDVKIQVEFNPATVREYRLIGYENRAMAKEDFNNDAKDAGELGAGHTVTALYEIVPAQNYSREYGVDPLVYQKENAAPIIRGNSSDIMTVKLRYKDPKGTVSKFIKKSVSKNEIKRNTVSENFRFASAVAEFGLLLRQSPYRGQASFDRVLREAGAVSRDPHGYRQEFTGLVEKARSMAPVIYPEQPEPHDYEESPKYPVEDERIPHTKGQK